jgi:hypothetical protein
MARRSRLAAAVWAVGGAVLVGIASALSVTTRKSPTRQHVDPIPAEPFGPAVDDGFLAQWRFEEIVFEVAAEMPEVSDVQFGSYSVNAMVESSSGKQRWQAGASFDGKTGGLVDAYASYPDAKRPRWFFERISERMRDALSRG